MGAGVETTGQMHPAGRNTRVSKKKRRTEISSSEESSSDSDDDEKTASSMANDAVASQNHDQTIETAEMDIDDNIGALQVPQNGQETAQNGASAADVLATRLKLADVQRHFANAPDGQLPPEEWVAAMVGQYGEDINQLRQSADFKEGTIAQVAQLLRESRHVLTPN